MSHDKPAKTAAIKRWQKRLDEARGVYYRSIVEGDCVLLQPTQKLNQ